jgi:hypothetical protein
MAFWQAGKPPIIGSQNDFIYLFGCHLEDTAPPVLQKIEDPLNQTPMSYLDMESPRAALFRFCGKTRILLQDPQPISRRFLARVPVSIHLNTQRIPVERLMSFANGPCPQ